MLRARVLGPTHHHLPRPGPVASGPGGSPAGPPAGPERPGEKRPCARPPTHPAGHENGGNGLERRPLVGTARRRRANEYLLPAGLARRGLPAPTRPGAVSGCGPAARVPTGGRRSKPARHGAGRRCGGSRRCALPVGWRNAICGPAARVPTGGRRSKPARHGAGRRCGGSRLCALPAGWRNALCGPAARVPTGGRRSKPARHGAGRRCDGSRLCAVQALVKRLREKHGEDAAATRAGSFR